MVDGYRGLYAGKYAPASYRQEVRSVISMLRQKYGVNSRDEENNTADPHGQEATAADKEWPSDQPIFRF
jgi:hypothetical protein